MLCTGFNVVSFSWIASAATELDSTVMDWMGKKLKLPSTFLFSGNEVVDLLSVAFLKLLILLLKFQNSSASMSI
ncbi:hypothetical protein AAC387_Pa04g1563 [Persea americana]